MIQLYDLGNGVMEISCEKYGTYRNGADLVLRKAIKWGIPFKELEYAIDCMLKLDHDYADLGS